MTELTPQAVLEQITSYSTDTILIVDLDARIRFISRVIEGVTREQVLGTVVYAHLDEADQEVVRRSLARVAETREPDSYVTRYTNAEGLVSRWEARVGPVLEDDEVHGFVIVANDVTERDKAAIERDRLFELSLDLLCIVNPEGYFSRVNPAFARTLGYTMQELTSRPFVEFLHAEDVAASLERRQRLIHTGTDVAGYVVRFLRKDGAVRTIEWSATIDPLNGNVIAIGRDVTETRALQDQLRQAQKMDAVGQLAGGIAHDFNNLLQAILGNVHFARTSESNPLTLDFLADIESAAERAAELTKKLLAFSRQQPVAFMPLDLNELIRELLVLLRRVIPSNTELDLIAGHHVDQVAGDRSQIEQVVMNLCLNARDALPKGGQITIETENILINGAYRKHHPWAKPGRYVLLSVSDNGVGIPEEIRDKIFDPFFTTKPQGRGVGMGLATAYGIVQQHEGMIQVYSEVGTGTTFKIYLPVAVRLASQVGSKVEGQAPGRAEVILVAEDEPLVRGLVVRTLERAGYQVLVANDGREAVKLCQAHDEIDLALLDVVMPVLSGPDAARQLAEIRPQLPVLFSSGYNNPAQFSTGMPEGATVLKKPYRVEDLLRVVRQALDAAAEARGS